MLTADLFVADKRVKVLTRNEKKKGDEFPHRLCDPLPSVTAVLYYRWLAAGLYDKIISQGVGGHGVYVGKIKVSEKVPAVIFGIESQLVTIK